MNSFKSLKLYKESIYNNRIFIFICFFLFAFSIFLDSFFSSREANVFELQLTYSNLNLFRQGVLYIPVCTIITMKLLQFADNNLIVLRLERKDKVWNQIAMHILITNFVISIYLVTFSYIFGLLFAKQRYMEFNKTLLLLIGLILLYTIGLSLFNLVLLIVKEITGNKLIAYMTILAIIVAEVLNTSDSLILSDISFNMEYLSNYMLVFFNILKFGGITILTFEFGRMLYNKGEIYNTKKLLIGENNYEN